MAKVLIVEDEKAIVDIIAFNLKREGYEVEEAYEGKGGLEKALSPQVDLVLLDVMLPGMDGFELLRRLREKSNVPVIMVTAREEERDKVLGLDTGADDYITKPFSIKELLARVKANIRRRLADQQDSMGGEKREGGPFQVTPKSVWPGRTGRPWSCPSENLICSAIFWNVPGGWSPGKS